ncbi:MAG: NAD-dependent epimerase/dehydratase family protein [Caldilinea sp. CFX5]|nr:NAD-dependent epimerase/dehydratase family protein [Caldilinea sp. CFX5]
MKILVTGANGFIGKNLLAQLTRQTGAAVIAIGRENSWDEVAQGLAEADFIYHLAGVNRPQQVEEFHQGNAEFTERLCDHLLANQRATPIVFTSSIQAELDNPYGRSKRMAEEALCHYAAQSKAYVAIYRLPNVFGKWCRPHYNSVVATFCHQLARDLPITISDPKRELNLIYIDDVVAQFQQELDCTKKSGVQWPQAQPTQQTTLDELAALLQSFRRLRTELVTPNFGDTFTHQLYATYLSYLPQDAFAYALEQKCDARGCLAEFIKAPNFGQIFVSRTAPGVTRGNHYHHTKTEKFLVLAGSALIRFRHLHSAEVIEYPVKGEEFRVVDIPPGYTHAIENIGSTELVTLFWASEIFTPERPDTYALPILPVT